MRPQHHHLSAFSLIEISVVVVVIGLVIGGIVLGGSMSSSVELQTMAADKEKYVSAIKQFRDKYSGLPGDLYNATSYWPEDTTGTDKWGDSTGSTVENGNGNGKIAAAVGTDGYESHRAWRQLALAGLIDGEYNGEYESSGTVTVTPGVRVPKATYGKGLLGWHVYYVGSKSSDSTFFDGQYDHILYAGEGSYAANSTDKGGMVGDDIASLDHKLDDGSPVTGHVRSGKDGGSFGGGCTAGDVYVVSTALVDCTPIFLTGIH